MSASKHTSNKLIKALSGLSDYLEGSNLSEEASDILKLAQQLGLFDDAEPEDTSVLPAFDPERYNLSLDWLDWNAYPLIPEGEKELRESIIRLLLEHDVKRSKADIIDEILSIEPGHSFFEKTKKYRKRFPELVMKDPVVIDERQLRIPGTEPAIRFMPRIDEADKEQEQLEQIKEETRRKEEEAWSAWEKKHEREPLYYEKSRWKLERFLEEEGLPPLPKEMNDRTVEKLMRADFRISQKEYNQLEQALREKYIQVQGKETELKELISSASTLTPEEPPIPNVNGLSTIEEFRNDLKERVIYLSHKVILDSAKWSMFGSPLPEAQREYSYGRGSDIRLFSIDNEELVDNEEALKDYMEKTPTLIDDSLSLGWYSYPNPKSYFKIKYKRLEEYEDSLARSMTSYRKGLRFLKQLEKKIDKELQGSLQVPEPIIAFVEKEMIDDMRKTYINILDALYDEREDATRESHYNHYGHRGAFVIKSYSRSEEEDENRGLSLFDINQLFHNKIKFYEVIENFSKLINLVISRPFRKFKDSFFAPAVENASYAIRGFMAEEIFEDTLPHVEEFYGLMGDIAQEPSKISGRDEKVDAILRQWLSKSEFSKGGLDYNSVFAYPNFIIKDKKVAKNVERNLRLKTALRISHLFREVPASSSGLTKEISKEITKLIQSGEIKITESDRSIEDSTSRVMLSIETDIINQYDKVKKAILPKIFSQNFISKIPLGAEHLFGDGSYSQRKNRFVFSDVLGLSDDYGNLANIIDAGVNADGLSRHETSYRYNRYKSSTGERKVIKEDLLDASRDPDRIAELVIGFRQSVLRYEKAYRKMTINILDLLDQWNFSHNLDGTREIAEMFMGQEAFPGDSHNDDRRDRNHDVFFDKEFLKRISKNTDYTDNLVVKEICPESAAASQIGQRRGAPLCAIINNVDDFLDIYGPVKLLDKHNFKKMLDMLAGEGVATEHRLEDNYEAFSQNIEQLNSLARIFAENLNNAVIQLKTLSYGALYGEIFGDRLQHLGTVGPRRIRRTLQGTKGKAVSPVKAFALTMLNPWIKETVNNVDRNVGQLLYGPDSTVANDMRTLVRPRDPLLEYWTGGAKDGEIPTEKAAALTLILAKRFDIRDGEETRRIYNISKKVIEGQTNVGNYGREELSRLAPLVFDNIDNLESKIIRLIKISDFAHNAAANMPLSFYRSALSDPNFKNLGKNATVGKYFNMCTKLNRLGGLAAIKREYKGEIEALRMSGMLQRGFLKTLRESYRACREGVKISPNLEGLSQEDELAQRDIRSKIEVVDTILTAITEHSAFSKYNEEVTKKDSALFNLDWEVPSKGFRFRVLKTYDPYHFRVGAETGCCQRLGGLGQGAAVDSYINPLAGVLILELKTEEGWRLASQSYFHYVPRTKSYILDNVETNHRTASKVWDYTRYSNLETLYAMLAQYMKEQYEVEYFLSGKGYSKISKDDFGSKSLSHDPRSFSVSKKYTDWKARGSIDLLNPKFDVPDISDIKGKKKRRKKKKPKEAAKPSESLGWPQPRRAEELERLSSWLIKNSFREEASELHRIMKAAGFITNLREDVSEDIAVQMEGLENQYFAGTYAQDYEDILDDMRQPGVSGIVYTDNDNAVKGYLYGFQLSLEDQLGIHSNYDEEDLEDTLEAFTCHSRPCSENPREFLRNILDIADSGQIFYATNFLVDKPHRHMVSELIQMLIKEVSNKGYKYMAFNALSATHRLLMSDGAPSKEREEKFGIKVLCELDMYAPLFVVEIL